MGDLGKLIIAKGFKKLPNLVTLVRIIQPQQKQFSNHTISESCKTIVNYDCKVFNKIARTRQLLPSSSSKGSAQTNVQKDISAFN